METIKITPKYSKLAKYRVNAPKLSLKKEKSTKFLLSNASTTMPISKINSIQLTPKESRSINCFSSQNICKLIRQKSRKSNCNNITKHQMHRMTNDRMKKIFKDANQQKEMTHIQRLGNLKKYVNSLSKRGSPRSTYKNQIKQQKENNRKKEDNKQFMMRELSFTQNDQQKIKIQKKVLVQYENLRELFARKMSVSGLSQNALGNYELKMHNCHRMIEKVYRCIQQMQILGYGRRSNKLIISYCLNNKIWLSNVFLQQSKEKIDNFCYDLKYLLIPSAMGAKINFSNYICKTMCRDINLIEEDIEGLLAYAEEILSQKKLVQLEKVAQFLEEKFNQAKEVNKMDSGSRIQYSNFHIQHIDDEKFNFASDIETLEQKFGNMKQISKVSRRRYEDLNRTYDRMHTLL